MELVDFEAAFLPHLDAAYSLARYLLKDSNDAEDVVQEACLRAIRHLRGFRGGDARAWLLAIVRRCCYSWFRRRRRDRETAEFDERVHSGDGPAADATTVQDSLGEQLAVAVRELPRDYREVVVLREVQGLSYKEIAATLEIPIGTVMSRLARARQRLHQYLTAQGIGGIHDAL